MNMPPHGYPQHPQPLQHQQGHGHPHAFTQGAAMQQSSHYEFGPTEDAEIAKAANWSKAVGVLGFVNAGVHLLSTNVLQAALAGIVGLLFFKGGSALANVVHTKGHDVHHVVAALDQFGQAFQIRFIFTVLAVLLLVVVLPLLFLGVFMQMSR